MFKYYRKSSSRGCSYEGTFEYEIQKSSGRAGGWLNKKNHKINIDLLTHNQYSVADNNGADFSLYLDIIYWRITHSIFSKKHVSHYGN